MLKVLTICPYCGCGCGLYLEAEGDNVIGSYPSLEHPVSRGSLCVKGWNSYEFINRPDRLKTPLIKENNRFRKAPWNEALDLVARKLKAIQEQHGNDSLAFLSSAKCTNEENFLMMKLARAVFKTNNIDHCARLCHASTVVGLAATFGSGAMTNSINEVEDAEVILVTGSDTTEQHPLIGSRILNVVEKGAKLIVVDPRKIQLTKHATYHLVQRCGTDVAWINGMMNCIIKEGLEDTDFIKGRTENYEELKEVVKDYSPEYVEEITGIPADKLIGAARLYAKAKRSTIIYSMGITQHTTGVDNVKSLANLAMLTGNIGKEGTGVNPLRGQNNVQGACDMGALPDVYSGYQKVTDGSVRKKFKDLWEVEGLPSEVGLTVTEIIERAEKGEVKGLYIMGENPVISDPDVNQVRKALSNLEFLLVQDIFLSDTAELADVVLPGASFAEKNGTYTNTERRVQRIRKIIEPIGNSKPDWEIICEIAKRCGYGMDYSSVAEIMDEVSSLTPIYGGISYNRLSPWGLQWPCPDKKHPGTPFLHKGKFTKGLGTFMPRPYLAPDELPDEKYPFTLTTGRTYFHWHTGTMTRRTSTLHRELPEAYIEMNPRDAEEMGIRNGEKLRVSSRRGEIQIKAKLTDKVDRGVVFIPFHFREAAANVLTNPAVDPIAKIPEYKVCAVRIEPQ